MKNKRIDEKNSELFWYLAKRKMGKWITSFFLFFLVMGLCFIILQPLIQLIPSVLAHIEDLGNPNVIWIPEEISFTSFKAAARLILPEGILTMIKSVLYAASITLIQIFICAMTGYTLARVQSWVSKVVMFLVVLAFLVPRQSLLLAQYIYFNHFDAMGLVSLFNASGEINLINQPITLYLMAILGFGVNQSLFILIFSQFFKNIPKELEEAALIDGCGFYKTYFKIMVPNAIPAISTVGVMSFVWNFGDTYYTTYFNPDGAYVGSILSQTFIPANKEFILNAVKVWYDVPLATDLAFDAMKQAGALIYLVPLLIVYFIAQRWLVENLENSGLVG